MLPILLVGFTARGEFTLTRIGPEATSVGAVISDDGSTVAGSAGSGGDVQPFTWTHEGGFVALPVLPGASPYAGAFGVSGDGSVVVGWGEDPSDGARVPLRWSGGSTPSAIEVATRGTARGVSADGDVVVGYTGSAASSLVSFRWTASEGTTIIGDLLGGGVETYAVAVSADGSVVVGNGDSGGAHSREAFRWTEAGGMQGIGHLGATSTASFALGISPDGSVIVGEDQAGSTRVAVTWADGATEPTALGSSPFLTGDSYAIDASAGGEIIVGTASGQAVYWDRFGDIHLLREVLEINGVYLGDWTLTSATSVSSDGATIAGIGRDDLGQYQTFVAMIPEPGTALLLATGLFALGRRRRGTRARLAGS